LYSSSASYSCLLSSSMESSIELLKSSILVTTLSRDSCEKVEATCTSAMMGLEAPNLLSSASAKEASLVLGSMVCNFSMMSSKAPIT
jgi:hypothetical protein